MHTPSLQAGRGQGGRGGGGVRINGAEVRAAAGAFFFVLPAAGAPCGSNLLLLCCGRMLCCGWMPRSWMDASPLAAG